MEKETDAILIIGPAWVGDMVMAQALFIALKKNNPHIPIDVLAPNWSLPLLERMPEIRAGIEMPVGHGQLQLGLRYRLAQSLKNHYQQAIVLPNSLKSALIPWLARIPVRTGWKGEYRYGLLNDLRKLNKVTHPLMVQRFVALAFDDGFSSELPKPRPRLIADTKNQKDLLCQLKLNDNKKTLILCPGAEFGDAKQWPEQHYTAVANDRIQKGWQVWLLGSNNDKTTTQNIIDLLPENVREHCINLAGKTALVDTIDLIAQADAVICNDSGLMHITAAVNTPLVVIYGSTSPDFTPPLSDKVQILQSDIDCAPCFKRTCPLQHKNCLQQQTPETTIHQLEKLIN